MGDKLCYGCFEPIEDEMKCPHCGYKQQSPYSPSYLAPGTMLNDKYMVGKIISHNGEGATYLAFDTVISCKVILKEYMPDSLCSRDQETQALVANSGKNVQYKSFMEEFTELNKKLAKLRTIDHIQPVLDMFHENNTTYVVFEYFKGQNLVHYLKENGGELSWRRVQKLFPPLFTSISQLHNAGIIHRAISPNTIYVTSKGELKLVDFCIAAVRTNKADLTAELFKGYAAPEQYSPAVWQGTWTDVYGISSVLYKILTGCMPTEASLRNENEDLTAPSALNSDIPDNVSEAIISGMKMNGEERIQTINDFVTLTFKPSDESKTRTVDIGSIASQNIHEAKKSRETVKERNENEERDNREDQRYRRRPGSEPPQQSGTRVRVRPEPEPEEEYEEFAVIEKVKTPVIVAMLIILVVAFVIFFINQLGVGTKKGGLSASLPALTTAEETTAPVTTIPEEEDEDNGFYIQDLVPATLAPAAPVTSAVVTTEITEFTTGGGDGKNIQMINFVGKIYDDVKLSSLVQDLNITVQYDNAEGKKKGEIIGQSIPEGTWIASGESVTLTVCKGEGTPSAAVTDANGTAENKVSIVSGVVPSCKKPGGGSYTVGEYLAILDDAGIPYKAVPLADHSGYPSKGYVVSTEPGAGASLDGILVVNFTPNGQYNTTIYSSGQ